MPSWNAKKREALHIRGPLKPDGTMHQCSENQKQPPPKTEQKSDLAIDHTKEIVKAIEDLTYSVNTMIYAALADSEAARSIVKARLLRSVP